MNILELKIKIKSLAEEARIIRKEEHKLSDKIKNYKKRHQVKELDEKSKPWSWKCNSLHNHRTEKVRGEARHSLLVYRMMKGFLYREIEPMAHVPPNLQKIHDMAMRFGVPRAECYKWLLDAQESFKRRNWYKQTVHVSKDMYYRSSLCNEDKILLTQEFYDAYTAPEPNRESKIKGILAKIIKRD